MVRFCATVQLPSSPDRLQNVLKATSAPSHVALAAHSFSLATLSTTGRQRLALVPEADGFPRVARMPKKTKPQLKTRNTERMESNEAGDEVDYEPSEAGSIADPQASVAPPPVPAVSQAHDTAQVAMAPALSQPSSNNASKPGMPRGLADMLNALDLPGRAFTEGMPVDLHLLGGTIYDTTARLRGTLEEAEAAYASTRSYLANIFSSIGRTAEVTSHLGALLSAPVSIADPHLVTSHRELLLEKTELQDQLRDATKRCTRLEAELQQYSAKFDACVRDGKDLRRTSKQQQQTIQELKEYAQTAEAEVDKLRAQLSTADEAASALQSRIDELSSTNSNLHRDLHRAHRDENAARHDAQREAGRVRVLQPKATLLDKLLRDRVIPTHLVPPALRDTQPRSAERSSSSASRHLVRSPSPRRGNTIRPSPGADQRASSYSAAASSTQQDRKRGRPPSPATPANSFDVLRRKHHLSDSNKDSNPGK